MQNKGSDNKILGVRMALKVLGKEQNRLVEIHWIYDYKEDGLSCFYLIL